ncbi:putative quinol monooxygenase [Sphingobacterium faecium]|uniref:putative quinol monooxygenase n=1 Tax=Sphingobacterium faecium TaxID=34087 RepID=UPI00374208A1
MSEKSKTFYTDSPKLSRQEDASIEYDVHQSIDDENIFILNEEWERLDDLTLHNDQSYSKEFFASFDKLQEQPIIYRSK